MKKKNIAILLGLILITALTACGKNSDDNSRNRKSETEVSTAIDANADVNTNGKTEPETNKSQEIDYDTYIKSQKILDDNKYQLSIGYKDNSGLYPIVTSEDGIIGYTYLGDNKLVTVSLDSSNNELILSSIGTASDGSFVTDGSVTLEGFFIISDISNVLFSNITMPDGNDAILIEARSTAYTFSDGVDYHMYIVEMEDDGKLNLVLDTWTCGSGDEDITSTIRKEFNDVMESDYTQDYFEDIFWKGNMYVEKEHLPVFAKLTFKSYTSDWADQGDWDRSNKVIEKIYGNVGEVTEWGIGEFKTF